MLSGGNQQSNISSKDIKCNTTHKILEGNYTFLLLGFGRCSYNNWVTVKGIKDFLKYSTD